MAVLLSALGLAGLAGQGWQLEADLDPFGAAIKTIPRASWARIYLLRLKVFFVSIGVYCVLGAVVALEVVVMGLLAGGK